MFPLLPTWLATWLRLGAASAPTAGHHSPAAPARAAAPDDQLRQEIPEQWNATTAIELIARLMELTSRVSSDVQEHSGHIESLCAELTDVKQGDSAAVAAVVCKLLVLNQETQRRLEQAELKLQAQQRQLYDVSVAARMDGLTGLISRRAFDESLLRSLADFRRVGRPASLLMLDVDHFKCFNDTHGHVAGDEALKHVADLLRTQSRETDVVARFGGEEFVVIFAGASLNSIKQRAERMRMAIADNPLKLHEQQFIISASAGLAELREGDDVEALLKRADAAMYAAKAAGRNCLFWHDGNQPLRWDLLREENLPAAAHDAAIGDRRRVSEELAQDKFADPTFVPSLSRRISEWRRGGATFSVILVRIDRLEEFSAQHGQQAEQAALKVLNQLARASLRDMDQPTRWSTSGLAILLPSARVFDAANIARRLTEAMERCELPVAGGTRLTLSVGAAEVIEGNDAPRLLERSLLALDAACEAGGGAVFVHDGLQTSGAPAGVHQGATV
jgi:diguanylate cyclase (GGDEF)-like protein